jgi:hypothetical protein
MNINLRKSESLNIETVKHKLIINSGYDGELSYKAENQEEVKVKDVLFEEQLDVFFQRATNTRWNDSTVVKCRAFLKQTCLKGAKALLVDEAKLLQLMIENCSYSAVNYFQEGRFFSFPEAEDLRNQIGNLNQEIYNLKKKHEKEVLEFQKQVTSCRSISLERKEAEGDIHYDYDISVNCPFCDSYQTIDNFGDWNPSDGDFEGNQECGSCGKIFSVKADRY